MRGEYRQDTLLLGIPVYLSVGKQFETFTYFVVSYAIDTFVSCV